MTHWKRNCVDELDKEKEAGACRCDPKNLEKNSERNFLNFLTLETLGSPLQRRIAMRVQVTSRQTN